MSSRLNIHVVALTYFLVGTAVIPMGFAWRRGVVIRKEIHEPCIDAT